MSGDPSCIFCQIIGGQVQASTVFQDEVVTAFMDIHPLTPGHLLVVPNRHVADLSGLDRETGAHMLDVGRRVASALRGSGVRCEGINLFLADGSAAGQTVFHLHLHVVPRFRGDGFEIVHGARGRSPASREDLEHQASRIRMALDSGGQNGESEVVA
jgi:histidine triad (HIT) family protein